MIKCLSLKVGIGTTVIVTVLSSLFVNVKPWPVDSYKELRYEHVRGQNTLSSCGPASLATLFVNFYGMETSEDKIIELVKPYLEKEMEKLKEGKLPEGGVSMLDLKKVNTELGVPAKGYEIPERKLFSILRKLKTPLLVHLEKPRRHFVLSVAVSSGQLILADPSWGVRRMGKVEFFDKWDGMVLAFSPSKEGKRLSAGVISKIKRQVGQKDKTQRISRRFLWK
jgi:predicted double-glycine peptidase